MLSNAVCRCAVVAFVLVIAASGLQAAKWTPVTGSFTGDADGEAAFHGVNNQGDMSNSGTSYFDEKNIFLMESSSVSAGYISLRHQAWSEIFSWKESGEGPYLGFDSDGNVLRLGTSAWTSFSVGAFEQNPENLALDLASSSIGSLSYRIDPTGDEQIGDPVTIDGYALFYTWGNIGPHKVNLLSGTEYEDYDYLADNDLELYLNGSPVELDMIIASGGFYTNATAEDYPSFAAVIGDVITVSVSSDAAILGGPSDPYRHDMGGSAYNFLTSVSTSLDLEITTVASVPEPATLSLLGLGLFSLLRRRASR